MNSKWKVNNSDYIYKLIHTNKNIGFAVARALKGCSQRIRSYIKNNKISSFFLLLLHHHGLEDNFLIKTQTQKRPIYPHHTPTPTQRHTWKFWNLWIKISWNKRSHERLVMSSKLFVSALLYKLSVSSHLGFVWYFLKHFSFEFFFLHFVILRILLSMILNNLVPHYEASIAPANELRFIIGTTHLIPRRIWSLE